MIKHKCETELTRQKYIKIYWYIWLDGHDRCLYFCHVKTLLDVKYTEQHNVRQTEKSQFEVSLSYLCPSHLWHCVFS